MAGRERKTKEQPVGGSPSEGRSSDRNVTNVAIDLDAPSQAGLWKAVEVLVRDRLAGLLLTRSSDMDVEQLRSLEVITKILKNFPSTGVSTQTALSASTLTDEEADSILGS